MHRRQTNDEIDDSSGAGSIECTVCAKVFTRKSTLKDHMIGVHEEKKSFQCDVCQVSFTWKTGLNRHFRAEHDINKPFECSRCFKTFGDNYALKIHVPKEFWTKGNEKMGFTVLLRRVF